jgi:nitrate/nitrite transporter NarK
LEGPSAPRSRADRVMSAVLIALGQSLQSLVFGGISLFLPLIRHDLHLSFEQAGVLAGSATLVYALMQIPAGLLADRVSPKLLFLVGLLGTDVLAFGFSVLHSFPLLVLNQALAGIFRSMVFAPGLLLISAQFSPRRRATALGLYVAGGFSSNVVLSLLGPWLVGPLGWRGVFVLFAALGLLVVVGYALVGDVGHQRASTPVSLRELRVVLWDPLIGAISIVQFVRLAVGSGLAFWLPTLIVSEKGFSLQVAGIVTAIGAAVTAPSNLLGGYLADRTGKPEVVIGGSLVMLAATTAVLPWITSEAALIADVAVSALFVQLYFGPLFSLPIGVLGHRLAGAVSGVGNFCANLGGFTSAYGLGLLRQRTGSYDLGLELLAGLCVVGALAAVWAGRASRTATRTGSGRSAAASLHSRS